MLRKLFFATILFSMISLTTIILGMTVIYNRGIVVFEQQEFEQKSNAVNLFVKNIFTQINILAEAHASWTLANEAVNTNDDVWITENLSDYLIQGDFDIDLIFIAKEDESVVRNMGFGTFDVTTTSIYQKVLTQDTEENSLIWIEGTLYFLSAMPLSNDDSSDKNGIFLMGRPLGEQTFNYLRSVIVPVIEEHFIVSPTNDSSTITDPLITFEVPSQDDSLYILAHIENPSAQYLKEKMIGHATVIISTMFTLNVIGFYIAILISAKQRGKLMKAIDSIQLSNNAFMKIPHYKIQELDLIGNKVNQMLQRIEQDYDAIRFKNIEIVELLSKANEINDIYTKEHSDSVSKICEKIGSKLNIELLDQLILSAKLHDVGKVFIPLTVLNKKEKLTYEEFESIKKHPEYGYNILKEVSSFKQINEGVLYHHERFDGLGYPQGLKGFDIPLFARIISVADVYDALISKRPYRDAFSKDKAIEIMKQESGKHFDPEILDVFLSIYALESSDSDI